jgi:hypothetical protein
MDATNQARQIEPKRVCLFYFLQQADGDRQGRREGDIG